MREFDELWGQLAPIGRDPYTGGYHRFAYGAAELTCRDWFASTAADHGLTSSTDRNGNMWARLVPPGVDDRAPALVLGSHLDSVPDGGAFDGPLGVVSAFAAVRSLRQRGWTPDRPLAIVAFADEEGAPFGVACAGSRLLTGELAPERARALVGRDGRTMGASMLEAGLDPERLGRDDSLLSAIDCYVEVHIEQGRALIDMNAPIGVGTMIWPHGRYRFTMTGQANHAGTTAMTDRRDPMIAFAQTALAAAQCATARDARATFGRMQVHPNGTNAIPHEVMAWLDARAATSAELDALLDEVRRAAESASAAAGTEVTMAVESVSGSTPFSPELTRHVAGIVEARTSIAVPAIPTGAGHDAGILATAGIPTAMLFVRNPTGISHSPAEFAETDDCHAGVEALAAVVEDLSQQPAWRSRRPAAS